MFTSDIRTVEPVGAAIDLDDLKELLYITDTDSDNLLTAYTAAATQWLESSANISLLTQTRRASYAYTDGSRAFRIPRPPLQSITSLEYLDADAVWQTLDSAKYDVDSDSWPACVRVRSGNLPATHGSIAPRFRITYVCGIGDTAADLEAAYPTLRYLLMTLVRELESGCTCDNAPAGTLLLNLFRVQPISLISSSFSGSTRTQYP